MRKLKLTRGSAHVEIAQPASHWMHAA